MSQFLIKPQSKGDCIVCGKPITIMIMRGSNFCCEACRKEDAALNKQQIYGSKDALMLEGPFKSEYVGTHGG